ncbi:MAG: hypothetical protein K9M03_01305 [Kiritimatiellales bacterium]|nr:hypothetical protein [Kiritimatiellales bacterium]
MNGCEFESDSQFTVTSEDMLAMHAQLREYRANILKQVTDGEMTMEQGLGLIQKRRAHVNLTALSLLEQAESPLSDDE